MTGPDRTAPSPVALEIAIARQVAAAVAAVAQSHGRSVPTAHAWIETLHTRYLAP